MRTPSSALPASPNGLVEGLLVKVLGRPLVRATLPDLLDGFATLAMLRTVDATTAVALPIALFFGFPRAGTLGLARSGFFAASLDFAFLAIECLRCSFYFLRILLCGLRLPILPLSLPAAGSI